MRRLMKILPWLMVFAVLLPACTPAPPPAASEVLTVLLTASESTAQTLPDGFIRLTAAPSDSPDRLTETFFSALYGEAARGLLWDGTDAVPPVQDAALYLSVSPDPFELGVFRCIDGDTAREVAALCRGRLDTLARGYAGSEWEGVAAGGRVAAEGNWVLLVLCEDPAPVLEAARRFFGVGGASFEIF